MVTRSRGASASPPYQAANCAGVVQARKTRSGGASRTRVRVMPSPVPSAVSFSAFFSVLMVSLPFPEVTQMFSRAAGAVLPEHPAR